FYRFALKMLCSIAILTIRSQCYGTKTKLVNFDHVLRRVRWTWRTCVRSVVSYRRFLVTSIFIIKLLLCILNPSCNEHMTKFINFWLEREEHNLEIVLQNAFLEVNNAFARYLTYARQGKFNF